MDLELAVEMPGAPSMTELRLASEEASLVFDPAVAAKRQAAWEETTKDLKPPDPVSPAPSETFKLELNIGDLSFSKPNLFTPFEQQHPAGPAPAAGSVLSPGFTEAKPGAEGSILPGMIKDVVLDVGKGVGITLLLAWIGWKIAGLPGALAGSLVWLGPNIPAALHAMRKVQTGEFFEA